ncbi:MAG: hypothetical protein AB7P07_15560 [Hyphomonadaceae bacterium]
MKVQWIVFAVIALIAVALWGTLGFCLLFDVKPALPIWAGLVTATALMSELTLWAAALAFSFGFLARRRALFQRWFGRNNNA